MHLQVYPFILKCFSFRTSGNISLDDEEKDGDVVVSQNGVQYGDARATALPIVPDAISKSLASSRFKPNCLRS